MRKLCLLSLMLLAGCGSSSLTPQDGGTDHPVTTTTGCMCQADSQTLTVSWDCFCQQYGCTGSQAMARCSGNSGTWTYGCGFYQLAADTVGGPEIWTYDQTGKLVGEQLATDDSVFVCPDNQGIQRFQLRAGQFRPQSCDIIIGCSCENTDASPGLSCVLDAGAAPP